MRFASSRTHKCHYPTNLSMLVINENSTSLVNRVTMSIVIITLSDKNIFTQHALMIVYNGLNSWKCHTTSESLTRVSFDKCHMASFAIRKVR